MLRERARALGKRSWRCSEMMDIELSELVWLWRWVWKKGGGLGFGQVWVRYRSLELGGDW